MKKLLSLLALVSLSSLLYAQDSLKFSTGSEAGTYNKELIQLQAQCANPTIVGVTSDGSNTNIDRLVQNEIHGAFVQSDVLFWRKRTENLNNVKTLFSLHNEQVHFVALVQSKTRKVGGTMGFGGDPLSLTKVSELKGLTVGAVGGSFTTAQIIRFQSEVAYNSVQYDNAASLKKALDSGQVDVALFVGGAPLTDVASLDPNYRLLNVDEQLQKKLAGVYTPDVLNYSKMKMHGVATISTKALVVVREARDPELKAKFAALRNCFTAKLPKIQSTLGTHAAWQNIDAADQGLWTYYDLKSVK
jgi:TRAP-type uncharacterized transport system substrate-binding protein